MRRPRPRQIPLAIAAAFVAVCSVVTAWNLSVAAVFPRLSTPNWNQLFGATEEKSVPISVASFLRGEDQTALSLRLGATLPIYAPAIRVRNQIQYSLFGIPNAPSVAFGREKWLYEWPYITEYCARNGETNAKRLADWAEKIRDIQDYATSHEKAFVYLITPSKAAIYPEDLPQSHPCPSVLRGTTDKLTSYRHVLDEWHIRYVDGAGLMAAERGRHEIELFPRGGIHWNALGASLAATELVSLVKAQTLRLDLDSINTAWTESRSPEGSDRDLVNMLNLYWFDTDYPVPKIAHGPLAIDRTCRPAKIMEVGGSFLEQINVALRESRCPPEISYWFYWNFSHVFYAEGKRRSAPPVQADRLADLAGSDVILLEENELMIGETDHLTALHGLVVSAGRMTSARDAPATR
jgi:alginate O-acetyltransferase complex protein AlgJ